jgi:hypothetical protein
MGKSFYSIARSPLKRTTLLYVYANCAIHKMYINHGAQRVDKSLLSRQIPLLRMRDFWIASKLSMPFGC